MSTNTKTGFLERRFQLKAHGTSVKTELAAGFTTFVTMAYILGTIPNILGGTGRDRAVVLAAMVMVCFVSTALMSLLTNLPFAMAPGLSSCAVMASIVTNDGYSAEIAAGIAFWVAVLLVVVSYAGLRDFVVRAIPANLKFAITAGVGLNIASVGLRNGGIIVATASNKLAFGDLTAPIAILTIIGFVLILITKALKIPGYLIISILITTVIGIPMGLTAVPETIISLPGNPFGTFLRIDFLGSLKFAFFPFILTLFMQDFFSTLGTSLGVGGKAGCLDEDANLPQMGRVFKVDSIATILGAAFGLPGMGTYLESSAGVEAGGRTGLSSLFSSFLLMVSLLFTPIALMIPNAATAPALIIIGIGMLGSMGKITGSDFADTFPAFVCVAMTVFAGGIANGICLAIPVYVILKICSGKIKEIHVASYVMTALSLVYLFSSL